MVVLSLFDGISCGQIALERAGIPVGVYLASEIDKYAIKITQKNYPNTIQLGDVRYIGALSSPVDLLMGGSPCQGFSSSGKGLSFADPRSALFFEFIRIRELLKPKWWLLENVKMKKEWTDIITEYIGVDYVEINSKYFSAQNRVRHYWCNWGIEPYEDKGIMLESIVEDNYIHSAAKRTRPIIAEGRRKSLCLEVHGIGKSMCLVTVNLNNLLSPLPKGKYTDCNKNDYPHRVMTPREMEKLQTMPENYVGDISSNRAAKVLGNGWTIDVIAHILKGIQNDTR